MHLSLDIWGNTEVFISSYAQMRVTLMYLEMATHSSVLAWRIAGMAEPGGLPSMGSHRVGHDWSNLAACQYMNYLLRSLGAYPLLSFSRESSLLKYVLTMNTLIGESFLVWEEVIIAIVDHS